MAFPSTLTNPRIYLDSKQNSGYTTRIDSESNVRVVSAPPLGDATLTGTTTDEINQPRLESDLLFFPDAPAGEGRILIYNETNFSIGHGGSNPDFILGVKFRITGGGGTVFSNDAATGRTAQFECLSTQPGNLRFTIKGSDVMVEGGANTVASQLQTSLHLDGTWNYIAIRGNLANDIGDVIINGEEFNNCVMDGVSTNGYELGFGSRPRQESVTLRDGNIEYIVGAQSFGTLDQLRDLDSFLRGELDILQFQTVRDGEAQEGVKVTWWQMDVFSASDVTGAFENMTHLGSAVSDANGIASLDVSAIGAYDATKVHFAAYADSFYRVSDGEWLLPEGFSRRNINLDAPE